MNPEREGGEGGQEGAGGERAERDGAAPGGPAPERPSEAVDRADYDPTYDPDAPVTCELCGGTMFYTAACKLKCPRCGYMRDCSDP